MNEMAAPLSTHNPAPITPLPRPSFWRRIWDFPLTRIIAYILLTGLFVLMLMIGLGIVSGAVALLLHIPFQRIVSNQQTLLTAGEVVAMVSALAAFWVMVRFADKRPWTTAGFARREMVPQTLLGFAIGAGIMTVGVGLLAGVGVYRVTGFGAFVPVLPSVLLYLCVGVFEETFFRGYLFQTLETRWGSGIAVVLSSLVFGLTHMSNHVSGVTPLQHLAGPAFICLEAGLPLAAAYLLTRRWWLSIGIHWAWDFFEGPVYGLHDSGNVDPHTLLHSHVAGPFLATGGPFGPEASLILLTTGTLLGIVLLRLAIKNGQWVPLPRRAARVPESDLPNAGSGPSESAPG